MKPKKTSKEFVNEFQEVLKNFKTTKELYNFAKENGYTGSAAAFSAFKKALLTIGVNYDAMRQQANEAITNALKEKAKEELVLYSDASHSRNRFAVCDEIGNGIYYGTFYENPENQAMAELEAAKKAIWVAIKYKEYKKLEALRLTLYVDAEWLIWQDNPKQKGFVLTQFARKNDILLEVKHVKGRNNPADEYTQSPDKYNIELYKKLDVESDFNYIF